MPGQLRPLPLEARAALAELRRGDVDRCLEVLEGLVAREPHDSALLNALGSVLAGQGQNARARQYFERALVGTPDYREALTNLGTLQVELGELEAARKLLERATVDPGAPAPALVALGRARLLLGLYREARDAFARATRQPGAHAGTWSQRCYASLLDPTLEAREVIAIHREAGLRLTAAGVSAPPTASIDRRKLRLGYLSPDLRDHSVASFLHGILGNHDRATVEVFLYSEAAREDETSRQLFALADQVVRSRALTHAELAARCRSDRVDVLIDLAGHTLPNRQAMFALAPAPVSFTYLGYPGTTGSSAFAGRISDGWADPIDDPALAGPEPLIRIAGGYFAYTPPPDAPEVSPPPAASGQPIVFGSFNAGLKLNEPLLAGWTQLLRRLPESRLLLKNRQLESADFRRRILRGLAADGVDPTRVELLAASPNRRSHLASYARVDIALDTDPYAGATTTCEALYMGVPVVTLAGERHASRLGVSILSALGRRGWIASDRSSYVSIACDLARDRQQLVELRRSLRQQLLASALGDGRRVARAIEGAARQFLEVRAKPT